MKKLIALVLITIFTAMPIFAGKPENVSMKVGQQRTSKLGKIKVNFIEVLEDSRCPIGVNCIWAGNARVKISLSKGKKAAKIVELNSMLQPQSIIFEGYDIQFGGLTPHPKADQTGPAPTPQLTVSIKKRS